MNWTTLLCSASSIAGVASIAGAILYKKYQRDHGHDSVVPTSPPAQPQNPSQEPSSGPGGPRGDDL